MSSDPAQEVAELFVVSCSQSVESSKARIKMSLKSFVDANDNPSSSANYASTDEDPVHIFLDMLQHSAAQRDPMWLVLLLRALKILSRKQPNRLRFGPAGLRAVITVLANPLNNKVAAEGANVLLNVCYEVANVHALLETPGVQQLLLFLTEEDEEVQANAAGAIQSICFQEAGRRHVLDKGGIGSLVMLLASPNVKVVTRAVGAIHNLSSNADAIREIRKNDGVPTLVSLLHSDHLTVSGSAAGALQNVSREIASRLIIRELDAVPALARLLSAPDVQAQVCASGALLNIVGPDLDQQQQGQQGQGQTGGTQRRGLGRLMSLCMAASAIYDSLFEQPPPPLV
ncbi:Vacuolar protein 8 [Tetrabaena socialis]|uniref:Vacuolar protein 8 n=1 Tax=Tetrabaena socialis TaxID=47790 RepID=A0A2J7ZTJ0_9CHLO|nr:Vacuolar protein 8 [Tetrabaena socialis]|eukprot:PNH03586.1 Vacuolar protein 8 [Tetrabaena socialis]